MLSISLSFVCFDSTLKKKIFALETGGRTGAPTAPLPPPAPVSTALSMQEVLLEEGEIGNLEEWSSVI